MRAFREERNTMHTKRSARWLSLVAALAAAALGSSVPLAIPAAAAGAESISVAAQQARYPVATNAVLDVTVTNPNVGDALTLSVVSGPDHANPTSSCTTINANGGATCTLTNTGGAGTDQVVVTDGGVGASSAPATVSFEALAAVADSNVGTTNNPTYLYGTGTTASITVTVTGASTTPQLTGRVSPGGPDAGDAVSCTQLVNQPGTWGCSLTNGGKAGADSVQIFDDDAANGTAGQADTTEAKATLAVNFEHLTSAALLPRSDTSVAGTAAFHVELTGKPAGVTPHLKEVITDGQFSSVGSCTDNDASSSPDPQTSWTCTVVNNGRADAATVEIFDDLDGNGSAGSQEPSATATVHFEVLTAKDASSGSHSTGSTATISVSAAGVPAGQTPSIDYVVAAGDPDATATPVICPPSTSGWTCSLHNGGANGTDHVTVFDDANNNGKYDANLGEPATGATIKFGDSLTATQQANAFPTKDANNAGSGIAPVDVVVTSAGSAAPSVQYTVTAGPDTSATAHACDEVNNDSSTWTCNVANGGSAGTDTVVISNAAAAAGAPTATVKVTFSVPSSMTLTPTTVSGQPQSQIATGGCQIYTLNVNPGVKFPVTITAAQGLGKASSAPAASLSTCAVPGGSTFSSTNAVGSSGGTIPILSQPTYTDVLTIKSTTGQDPAHPGQVVFGISSSYAGPLSVSATTSLAANNVSAPAQTLTVVTPGPAHTVTVTPANPKIAAGATQAFSALVQDSTGTALPGAAVSYVVAAGDPDATASAVACQAADQFGQAKCTLTNNRTVGVDHVTFFSPLTSGEKAPAANDPQTTTNLTVQALPPAGSKLTFGCPDEIVSDINQIVPACTVTTGSGSVIFAAHLANASGTALSGIPVTFTLVGAPTGSTATTGQVSTNAKGNALYVVTVPSPSSGEKVTVQAAVGDPSAGGLGPDTAIATFQAPHPAAVSVTPASQRVAVRGVVNLTARVTDQFGAGVAGQSLTYTVSGRNPGSGALTTGANGAAAISYADTGASGGDTVSVVDVSADAPSGAGSNNPATAVVTFGSGGCTANCGGNGKKESPTLKVTQSHVKHHMTKLKLVVTSHPKLVGAKVTFYQMKHGKRRAIGHGTTNRKGKVTGTLKAARGLHLKFQAKVKGKAGVKSGFSKRVKVHVK